VFQRRRRYLLVQQQSLAAILPGTGKS